MREKEYDKLRGGYYTPKIIADFLCQWAIQSEDNTILEPSCGDGIILESAAKTLLNLGAKKEEISNLLFGIEIDNNEAGKAVNRLKRFGIPHSEDIVTSGDFFQVSAKICGENPLQARVPERLFDIVVGNPPFIRYQNFPRKNRRIAFELMKNFGFKPNGLTNAWVPFLVISSMVLRSEGKLAMVIPAELFQVKYAAETRKFLSNFFRRISIITFRKLQFKEIQQEVVLLLAEKNTGSRKGIRVIEVCSADDLRGYNHEKMTLSEVKPLDHTQDKWTQYFLEKDEILLLRRLKKDKRIPLIKDVMEVDVGVVTGRNAFFVLTKKEAEKWEVEEYSKRVVGRSNYIKGIVFTEDDWFNMYGRDLPSLLFCPPDRTFDSLPKSVRDYINNGRKNGIHKGYKCRIRRRWYIIPSIWIPDAFVLRQIHDYPKIILNKAETTCTDTIHRAKFIEKGRERVAVSFLNSLTFAFSEVVGRSYGGGVLTFEPTEVEALPLPLERSNNLDIHSLDKLVRKNDIESVLDITDQILLIDGLELSSLEVETLRRIWKKLRDRRIQREH